MYVLIGADTVPTEANEEYFASGNIEPVIGKDLQNILQNAERRIFNIEAPITDRVNPIPKCGPNLSVPSKCMKGLVSLHIDLATLANNHIMDQGEDGLIDVCRNLSDAGVSYVGVGKDPVEAKKPSFFDFNGKRIGVYSCVEHEFSAVDRKSPGANPFDPLETPDDVAALKAQCDFVIVLYHGGVELYRYPSPQLRTVCRKLIDKGADLVVCQHSHCIGCEEEYGDGRIVYGQGNFLFALRSNEFWNSGLLIQLNEDFSVTYIPTVRSGCGVRMAQGAEAEELLASFRRRSAEITDDAFVENAYGEFAKKRLSFYLNACYPRKNSLVTRALNKFSGGKYQERKLKKLFGRLEALRIYNYVICEAHRELFIRALKDYADNR